jgi:rhamnulokinase
VAKKTRNYLALDLGAESGRGIIGRFDGKTISIEEVYRFQHQIPQYRGSLRWDILQIASQLKEALASAAAKSRDLVSLGVDTWGVDCVLLDKNGDLLGYPYHYRDARNDAAMEAAIKKLGREKIYEVTGLQFLPFNTLFQLYAEKLSGSGRLDAAQTMLFIPDFLSYYFGGEKSCEYTIASTSAMLDAKKRTWAKDLIKSLGIPTGILPRIVQPSTVTGTLLPELAAATGAPAGLKIVAPGRHDTASAVAAVPANGVGWAYLSSGTWSLFGSEIPKPVIKPEGMAASYTNEGGLDGTIRYLTNIVGLWLVQELRRAWTDRAGKGPDYTTLTAEAAKARPFKAIINPNWAPFHKPFEMPKKIARYCQATGQKPPRSQGEYVRCALESLALMYRASLEKLVGLQGKSIERLHIIGGGTQNRLLNQLAADACGIEVLAGPVEATAMGNILSQMIADGAIGSLEEGRRVIAASCKPERFTPSGNHEMEEAYAKFKTLVATDVPAEG